MQRLLGVVMVLAACGPGKPEPAAGGGTAPLAGKPIEPAPARTPLAELIRSAEVGSDDALVAALGKDGQDPTHTVPPPLAALLTSVEILRMSMAEGYELADGHHQLLWFFGELGIAGKAGELSGLVTRPLVAAGFAAEAGTGEDGAPKVLRRTRGELEEWVEIEGPAMWVGGAQEAGGFALTWTTRGPGGATQPTLGDLLQTLPFLRDPRIDAAVYQALAGLPVVRAVRGGTWTRYYSLSLLLGGDASFAAAEGALVAAGFTPFTDDQPDARRLMRKRTGSFAQVDRDSAGTSINIQPES